MSAFPGDLRYRESHEWVRVEGDVATVGITSFALEQLGDVVGLEIDHEPGDTLGAGDSAAEIESVKAASDIYAPISGELLEVNGAVSGDTADFEALAADPYNKGWMFKIKMSDPAEVEALMTAEAYSAQVAD